MAKHLVLADLTPPTILGAAALTTAAFSGTRLETLGDMVEQYPDEAARLHDQALLALLGFRPQTARTLQAQAFGLGRLFRVARATPGRLRVLAVMQPGDLMANTPLGFMLQEEDVRLDLLYHLPGQALPEVIPDHDVAVFAASDLSAAEYAELQTLFEAWPRPAINAPGRIPGLARDALCETLADIPTICSPHAKRISRAWLRFGLDFDGGPLLIRPAGTHAGQGLARIETPVELTSYLEEIDADPFYVTRFVDYRSEDGQYRKYRVAFIDGAPFLCHMAISHHWMIHYLNAGMTEDPAKRADEAQAMAAFDQDFAARHADAFAALNDAIGLDYHAIDCAELADGRLLVFEADNAAIIHMMDPPDLFPYKRPQMQKTFAAFADMLRRRKEGKHFFFEKKKQKTFIHDYGAK